jgi:hypothetical protein
VIGWGGGGSSIPSQSVSVSICNNDIKKSCLLWLLIIKDKEGENGGLTNADAGAEDVFADGGVDEQVGGKLGGGGGRRLRGGHQHQAQGRGKAGQQLHKKVF